MKRGETELTEDQLQMAWRTLRRHGWPETMAQTFADPVHGQRREGCVRGLARQLNRGSRVGAPRYTPPTPAGAPPVPPTPTHPPARSATPSSVPVRRPTKFDARKAAANDRD